VTTGNVAYVLITSVAQHLEYLVVHEMTHHLERNHGQRFTKLMDKFLPEWRSRRDALNEAPLADERWQA
jgi:predicted metal-dependent hydrolase